jgi:hypothetical protein
MLAITSNGRPGDDHTFTRSDIPDLEFKPWLDAKLWGALFLDSTIYAYYNYP